MRRWLLPEHLEDILPPEAHAIERMRRTILDHFHVCGYELVIPPMLEYLDSLLSGTGTDLELATFKLVDQLDGRMLGVRADHTPQVTRIDAHLVKQEGVTRLCYAGSVLHTRPSSLTRTREPLQIGAEIYGHAGLEADIEILRVMVEALQKAGIDHLHVDIGFPTLFFELVAAAGIDDDAARALHDAIERRDVGAIGPLVAVAPPAVARALQGLPGLFGDRQVLDRLAAMLPHPERAETIRATLTRLADSLEPLGVEVTIDFAELGGFAYESGIVFAAFTRGFPDAIARGGRYDEVGGAFGRPRPATGFTFDLRQLARVVGMDSPAPGILAPWLLDPIVLAKVNALRAAGEVVLFDLPGHESARGELRCNRQLINRNGEWVVQALAQQVAVQ
jgi:ATP phosphoribosyltransferase regulatory subunit